MLEDYFSLRISENGILEAIPSLIADYIPQMEGLPDLVLDLVQDVSWDEERSCFEGISTCLASFFCLKERFCDGEMSSALGECSQPWKHVMSDILFPSMKNNFLPPTSFLSKKVFCRLVDLHDLYKVFERC
ncbi:hypothetical protein AB6A40_011681 [Gnathostoma spinigerum]|uniref:DNA mismatch repair protein Mlh1 C-terminal domain-containing protein n=1 Tax=Gnathostoma spinigerum TaxID=75299 RepID=A0ABD6F0E8_9BILA